MSRPPSAALNHNYVPGMLHFHYNAAVDLLIIVPLTSMNAMHLFTKHLYEYLPKHFMNKYEFVSCFPSGRGGNIPRKEIRVTEKPRRFLRLTELALEPQCNKRTGALTDTGREKHCSGTFLTPGQSDVRYGK